jgi:hypothetical protein
MPVIYLGSIRPILVLIAELFRPFIDLIKLLMMVLINLPVPLLKPIKDVVDVGIVLGEFIDELLFLIWCYIL